MRFFRTAPTEQPLDVFVTPGRLRRLQRECFFHLCSGPRRIVKTGQGMSLEKKLLGRLGFRNASEPVDGDPKEAIADSSFRGLWVKPVGKANRIASADRDFIQNLIRRKKYPRGIRDLGPARRIDPQGFSPALSRQFRSPVCTAI